MLIHEGSSNVHLLVNLDGGDIDAFTSEPAEEEELDLAVVLLMSHVGAAEGSALSVATHVASYVRFLCVCMCSASLLAEPANGKVVAMNMSLEQRPLSL